MNSVLSELGVAMGTDAPLEFMGPTNFHVMGVLYVVMTHGGIKAEGKPYPGNQHETPEGAKAALADQISQYIKGAQQIAWRALPTVEQDLMSKLWTARARLARFPEENADA